MGATIQNKNTDELISFEEFKNLNREQITTMLDLKGVYLIVIRDSLGRPYFKVGSTGNGKKLQSCFRVRFNKYKSEVRRTIEEGRNNSTPLTKRGLEIFKGRMEYHKDNDSINPLEAAIDELKMIPLFFWPRKGESHWKLEKEISEGLNDYKEKYKNFFSEMEPDLQHESYRYSRRRNSFNKLFELLFIVELARLLKKVYGDKYYKYILNENNPLKETKIKDFDALIESNLAFNSEKHINKLIDVMKLVGVEIPN